MGKVTLIIMAAGIGSRFGKSIKQLESVGPNGETIMDYSIYDALEAGFDKIVFVIRKDLSEELKKNVGNRVALKTEVHYVYQELDGIPVQYREKFKDRIKPWGTGQAILCCKDVVKEPFLVINADDFYGKRAFCMAHDFLTKQPCQDESTSIHMCMIGFVLKNTLSNNGGVTRGICTVDSGGILIKIQETQNICRRRDKAVVVSDTGEYAIDADSIVSMNMWGIGLEFFETLALEFDKFLENLSTSCDDDYLKREYLLPVIIGNMLKKNEVEVEVLQSFDNWFGVTYKEDKLAVSKAIDELVEKKVYPRKSLNKKK